MTFSLVLEKLKTHGGVFTRTGWDNINIRIGIQNPDPNSKMTLPYLIMWKYANIFPITLSCESIMADDWIKV